MMGKLAGLRLSKLVMKAAGRFKCSLIRRISRHRKAFSSTTQPLIFFVFFFLTEEENNQRGLANKYRGGGGVKNKIGWQFTDVDNK